MLSTGCGGRQIVCVCVCVYVNKVERYEIAFVLGVGKMTIWMKRMKSTQNYITYPTQAKKKKNYVKTLNRKAKVFLFTWMHAWFVYFHWYTVYMCACMYIPMQAFECSIQKADYCAQDKDKDKLLWIWQLNDSSTVRLEENCLVKVFSEITSNAWLLTVATKTSIPRKKISKTKKTMHHGAESSRGIQSLQLFPHQFIIFPTHLVLSAHMQMFLSTCVCTYFNCAYVCETVFCIYFKFFKSFYMSIFNYKVQTVIWRNTPTVELLCCHAAVHLLQLWHRHLILSLLWKDFPLVYYIIYALFSNVTKSCKTKTSILTKPSAILIGRHALLAPLRPPWVNHNHMWQSSPQN